MADHRENIQVRLNIEETAEQKAALLALVDAARGANKQQIVDYAINALAADNVDTSIIATIPLDKVAVIEPQNAEGKPGGIYYVLFNEEWPVELAPSEPLVVADPSNG